MERIEIDVEAAYQDSKLMVEKYPHRGPAAVVYAMRPYIEGKVVCDLGCGGGDLMWLMARYADHVTGIECDWARGQYAYNRAGGNIDFSGRDYFEYCPQARVYYMWPDDPDMFRRVADMLRGCTFIAGARKAFLESELDPSSHPKLAAYRKCHILELVKQYNGKVLTFPIKEDCAPSQEWSSTDEWSISIMEIP